MYDIVGCKASARESGFEKFYREDELRIVRAGNGADSAKHKNKKVLIFPEKYEPDEGAFKLVAERKKACFLIDLGGLINSGGVRRAILISMMRRFLRMCVKTGAFYALVSFSKTAEEIRSAEELIAIGGLLGLNRGQAKFALRMLKHYQNEKR